MTPTRWVSSGRQATLALVAAACADFAGTSDPAHGLPDVVVAVPSFSQHIAPIMERRCTIGGCHTVLSRQSGLVLTRDSAHAALVGQPSRIRAGEVLIRSGDALNSWLIVMLRDDATRRDGASRMPLGSGPLTANQIATLVNWIDRGATPQ